MKRKHSVLLFPSAANVDTRNRFLQAVNKAKPRGAFCNLLQAYTCEVCLKQFLFTN
jgi:hypothetical protein